MDEVEWNNEKFAILMCPTVSFKKKIKFIADCEDFRARVAADRAERRRAIPFD